MRGHYFDAEITKFLAQTGIKYPSEAVIQAIYKHYKIFEKENNLGNNKTPDPTSSQFEQFQAWVVRREQLGTMPIDFPKYFESMIDRVYEATVNRAALFQPSKKASLQSTLAQSIKDVALFAPSHR